ncbi:site-specific integrase [Marinactinospora endophytica]
MVTGELAPLRPSGSPTAPVWTGLDALETADAMHTAAAHLQAAATRPNTEAAFAQDWARWLEFCEFTGHDPYRVSADALVVFVGWLGREPGPGGRFAAPATIERRITGVLAGWRRAGLMVPSRISKPAREQVGAYAQGLAERGIDTGRGPAPFLRVADLRAMCQACPDSLAGRRDRALLLIGFGAACRRSELAGLRAEDVVVARDETGRLLGLRVRIRTSKTGHGRTVSIARGSDPLTCAADAWQQWRKVVGYDHGPALLRVTRHDTLVARGVSAEAVGEIIRRAGERAGVEGLSGHSLRAGLATAARLAGHDIVAIARIGGWRPDSPELARYLRVADEWSHQDNATVGIGL